MIWLLSLVSVVLVSLVSLVGLATLSMSPDRIRRLARFFVSFAVGALLGDAFIHLVPRTFADSGPDGSPLGRSLLILGGLMVFFVVEKLLRRGHAGEPEPAGPDGVARRPELAAINVLGDMIHNFIDGVLIGASYLAGPAVGVATTMAVLFHEIPQELGDFGILIHSGLSVRRAVLLNLASASVAVLGTALALVLGSGARQAVADLLIPMAAGGFVYIAAADLIPELQQDRSLRGLIVQTVLISLGIAVMGLLTFVG